MPDAPVSAPAPAPSSSPAPASTPTPSTSSTPEPKVTWGSPDAIDSTVKPPEKVAGDEGGEPGDSGDFGDESFDDEISPPEAERAEEFSSEAYQKLKQALAAEPELFKQVKKAVSENKRFKEIAKSPEELRATFDRLDTLGGVDAIEAESKEWGEVYEMFRSGDPGVIDYWAKDNPEGLMKLMPSAYDRWCEMDAAGWTHASAKTFMATAHQSGLATILETLAESNDPAAKKLAEKGIGILNAVNAHAEKSPERDLTPEAKKLDQRSQELSQKENALYQQGVSAKVVPVMNKIATNALNAQLKGRQLKPEQRNDLMVDIRNEYSKLAKNDAEFQKNAKALLAANETEKFLKLVSSNMERTMPLAARRIWRKYAGISGLSAAEQQQRKTESQSRTEAGGGGTSQGMVKTAPPNPREVDWQRMRDEMGRDKADEAFSFGVKDLYGGKRFYYKKGDKKGVYTF